MLAMRHARIGPDSRSSFITTYGCVSSAFAALPRAHFFSGGLAERLGGDVDDDGEVVAEDDAAAAGASPDKSAVFF